MPAADEQQLIREAQDGNRSAFRCLVERHMKQAYNVAYGFVQDHESSARRRAGCPGARPSGLAGVSR